MDLTKYINKNIPCACGKVHSCNIEDIIIESGALNRLPEVLSRHAFQKIVVVSDCNTEAVAGKQVKEILTGAGFSYDEVLFDEEELIPNEYATGSLIMSLPVGCDLILAVGGGTINDLCRMCSAKMGVPYYILATAASMDGFASNVAPMVMKNLKTTFEVGMPAVIIGDLDIMKDAPLVMTAAGAGDVLGKYVCLTDWKLSSLITGEYHCEYVESLIRDSIEAVVNSVDGALAKDPASVAGLMEGLVLSGIAMSYVGNSRPASGSEHHLSHYWEMMSLLKGSHGALHGTKVGIGTVLGLCMYRHLPEFLTDEKLDAKRTPFDREAWDETIRKVYFQAASSVLALEDKVEKNSDENVKLRKAALKEHREEILSLIEALPSAEEIRQMLIKLNAAYLPEQIQVTEEQVRNSVWYAKDLRNRYGLLQVIHDLEIAEDMIDIMMSELHMFGH